VTNRQIQGNAAAPSVASIVWTGVWASVVVTVTALLVAGAETDREFIGAVLGVLFSVSLLAQCVIALIKRAEASEVVRRQVLAQVIKDAGYTPEDGLRWLARERGMDVRVPTWGQHKPGPY